jgi:hypothetical protein
MQKDWGVRIGAAILADIASVDMSQQRGSPAAQPLRMHRARPSISQGAARGSLRSINRRKVSWRLMAPRRIALSR